MTLHDIEFQRSCISTFSALCLLPSPMVSYRLHCDISLEFVQICRTTVAAYVTLIVAYSNRTTMFVIF
jgi:hypothetical protein